VSLKLKRRLYFGGAIFAALASAYSLLWSYTAASLACTTCNCTYSLFAAAFRCRQPDLGFILALAMFLTSWLLVRCGRATQAATDQTAMPSNNALERTRNG
jgi:hypothetical protein